MHRTEQLATSHGPRTVTFRLLVEWGDLEAAADVVLGIWGRNATSLASPHLLRAYSHFGNPVIGAFDERTLCGVSIGFLTPSLGVHLHSHITGVLPSHQHLGVGFGLKAAQRQWCLDHDIESVTWTFDPLIARNAHFNIRKLGALSRALLPDFYGEMFDEINDGEETDRLEVIWPLTSARVENALRSATRSQVAVADGDGARGRGRVVRTVAVPDDYDELRRKDRSAARRWRAEVRDRLAAAFADGLEIVDFERGTGYCFAPVGAI